MIFSVAFVYLSNMRLSKSIDIRTLSFINLFLSFAINSLLIGLRGQTVGVDTAYYVSFYNIATRFNFNNLFNNIYEPGFVYLSYLLRSVNASIVIFLIVCSSITMALFYIFYYPEKQLLSYGIIFAYCTGFIFFMMNGMRQAIAVMIFSLSIKYIRNKNPVKYCLVIFLAFLFHYSAILLLPLYFIIQKLVNINYKTWAIIIIISIFINPSSFIYSFANRLTFLPKDYSHYINILGLQQSKFGLGFIFHIFTSIFSLYYASRIPNDKYYKTIYTLYFIGIALMNMTYQSQIFQRFNVYFMFFQIPSLSYICYYLRKHNFLIQYYFIIILFLFDFIYRIIVGDSGCSPYQFGI